MKNDSSTMTFSYDKKTQASYNNILEDKPFRTAQPKVLSFYFSFFSSSSSPPPFFGVALTRK